MQLARQVRRQDNDDTMEDDTVENVEDRDQDDDDTRGVGNTIFGTTSRGGEADPF